MVRLLGGLAAAGAVLLSCAALAQEAVKVEGRWNTSNGPITISADGAGGYTIAFAQFPGKVTATLKGDKLTGQWWDVAQIQPCGTESEGTKSWGGFQVTFYGPPNIEKPAFQGIWTYCQIPPADPPEGGSSIEGSNFAGELEN